MPPKSAAQSRKNATAQTGSNKTIVVKGTTRLTANIGVGNVIDSLALNDSIATNLASLSDMYGLYRYVSIMIELLPMDLGTATAVKLMGVGFTPEVLLTNPASILELMQMPFNVVLGRGSSANFESRRQILRVGRADLLKTGVKWFRTMGKGTESDWETQGTIVYAIDSAATTSAAIFYLKFAYAIEFTDQLPLSVTRERLREQLTEEVREKMRLSLLEGREEAPNNSGRSNPQGDQPRERLPPDRSFYYRALTRAEAV